MDVCLLREHDVRIGGAPGHPGGQGQRSVELLAGTFGFASRIGFTGHPPLVVAE